jgi:glycerophosphoryl diester phosphodiesterase
MKYIAHRGLSNVHKDNSIEAIGEALSKNYYGVEIDVQLCKSGEIVLYHDVYTSEGFVDKLAFDELKKMGICSLQEIYDALPGIRDVVVIVDIKGNDPLVAFALQRFYQDEDTSKVYFSSFNRNLVGLLPSNFNIGTTLETTFVPHEFHMVTKGVQCVVLHWTSLDHEFIAYCKERGIQVFTYTHKEPREHEYMLRYDVDAIITNG